MSEFKRTPGSRPRLHRITIEHTPSGRYRWCVLNMVEEPVYSGICLRRSDAHRRSQQALRSLPKEPGTRSHFGTIVHGGKKLDLTRLRQSSYSNG